MQESGAKRPDKLLQRNSTEENDRADTSSSACQVGDADGDVPAHPSKTTELAQTPESSQETAIGYSALSSPPRGGVSPAEAPPPVRTGDETELLSAAATDAAALVPLRQTTDDSGACTYG